MRIPALLLLLALTMPAMAALPPGAPSQLAPAPAGPEALPLPPCAVPDVHPGLPRVDGGPDEVLSVRFALDQPASGTVAVWFALRAHTVNPQWPGERATAAGFLEDADGALQERLLGSVAVWPYGLAVDAPGAGLRVAALEAGCWGAFGDVRTLALPAGEHRLVVLGASEAGSRFAAFLPAGARVLEVRAGPAQELSAATLPCAAKARVFVNGFLAEALQGCAFPLQAGGRAYRALIATWGPTDLHDVRWLPPSGAPLRCHKAPNWCADVNAGDAGPWTLDVPRYTTLRHPFAFGPPGIDGYSGLFGVFAGRP